MRQTKRLKKSQKLSGDDLVIFSFDVYTDDEPYFSLGIKAPEILDEEDYVDYTLSFDRSSETIEIASLL